MMLARLKKHDPSRGHVKQNHTHRGQKYEHDRWYEVADSIAAELALVREHELNPNSPMAFDVMSRGSAVAMEHEERRQREEEKRTPAETPIKVSGGADLTSADLAPPAPPVPPPAPPVVDVPVVAAASAVPPSPPMAAAKGKKRGASARGEAGPK